MSDMQLIPFGDLQQMANVVAKAGCFGFKTMEQAAALMLVAQADGLHPAKAATHYHIINGKPSLTADAMLARFQGAGGRVNWDAYSDDGVTGTFSHPQGGSVAITWTIARAKKAGVGNLDKFPAAMLRARCISEGVRTVYPGVIVGMYTPEEVSTFEQPIRTFEQPIRTLEIETVQETAPDSITLAPTMESLVLAFQDAVQGHLPSSAFYQLCKTAATTRKGAL
jgi:hypothetical protein